MNLCLNAFVIQFPDGLLDTCSVTAPRALLLPYAHRGHCKDEGSYKEYWSHVKFSISLTTPSSATAECGAAPAWLGGKAAAEAGAVTHGAVRCSAWLGVSGRIGVSLSSHGQSPECRSRS